MPRKAEELKALQVSRLSAAGLHPVGKVAGLGLQITESGAKSWILRTMVAGKRREMGLGAYPGVTLAMAHEKAQALRDAIAAGGDPLQQRREAHSKARADRMAAKTFEQCADEYIQAHQSAWKNPKHGKQWRATLEQYAFPAMGSLLVRDVAKEHVLGALQEIWQTKTETATRVRGRIELVLSYAMQAGYRPEGINPARWRGGLDKLLPEPSKVAKGAHFAALPIDAMGEFMARLRQCEGIGAMALEFAILTAARSGEVRGATWGELDLAGKVWTIPGSRMKAGNEHRIPLSAPALEVLAKLTQGKADDVVFPAPRGGKLSDMALTAVLRRMGVPVTVHGFRSTFRDWAGERTTYPRDLAEMALAHTIKDKAEAAYRRGDMLARRVPMMAEWAAFVGREARADVVQIASQAAA